METVLTQSHSLILPFLLLALFGLCLHVLLWRSIAIETLSLELLRIEAALLSEVPRRLHADERMLRFQRLLANCRRYAGSLVFTRLILASVLLPARDREVGLSQEGLLAWDHAPSWDASLHLHAEFERAVIRRMAVGSPLLWGFLLYIRLFHFHGGCPRRRFPGMDSLELTFPIRPSRERQNT